jgi:hypothetical protein
MRWLVALVLVALLQGPAMLVQQAAWAGMLLDYTRERGFRRGVVETFDGEHPCCLCKRAAELREQESPPAPADRKYDPLRARFGWGEMILGTRIEAPAASGREVALVAPEGVIMRSGRGADAPPSPPPERV